VGSSKIIDQTSCMNTPYVVSRYYRAPELILASNQYDHSIDIWATGCMLFELITRTPMFPGDTEGLQIIEMQQILGAPDEYTIETIEKEMQVEKNVMELFRKCCNLEKNQKLDLLQMFKSCRAYSEHNFYTEKDLMEAAKLIEKCLMWLPRDRLTAADAMQHKFFADK